jgi:hypothetical protein
MRPWMLPVGFRYNSETDTIDAAHRPIGQVVIRPLPPDGGA